MTRIQGAFAAIISLLVGIFVSSYFPDIKNAQGPTNSFLIFLALFSVKMFLDDFSHFGTASSDAKGKKRLARGFWFSIGIWILLLVAFVKGLTNLSEGVLCVVMALLIATVWISLNYMGVADANDEDKKRHVGFAVINCVDLALLSLYLGLSASLSSASVHSIFIFMAVLVLVDAIRHGTAWRLVG